MGSIFSKPKVPEPIVAQTAGPDTAAADAAAKEAAEREALRIRKKRGYRSMIATSEQGITEAPKVLKETLG